MTVHLGKNHLDDHTSVLDNKKHLMWCTGEETPLAEANLACQLGCQVLNLHQSVVIDLEFANDEIIDRRRHLKTASPRLFLTAVHFVEFICLAIVCLEKNDSHRTHLDARAPKLALEICVGSNFPTTSLTVDGEDGGMMHNLLSKETVPLQARIIRVILSASWAAPFQDSQAQKSRREED